jgi:uncharacterized protein (DUF2141 family)
MLVVTFFAFAGEITVEIVNLKDQRGQLYFGLYTSEKAFGVIEKAYKGKILPIAPTSSYVLSNVPDGVYALAVFHDKNHNGQLDKNLFGLPKEGFGFSNNPNTTFSQPSFEEAKFVLKNSKNLRIKVQYR